MEEEEGERRREGWRIKGRKEGGNTIKIRRLINACSSAGRPVSGIHHCRVFSS